MDGTGVDDLTVVDGASRVCDVVSGRDHVLGSGDLCELQAAGDVVIVDVGLQDVGDSNVMVAGEVQHSVDVALGVHDPGDRAVGDEVAAVAQRGGLERGDVEAVHAHSLGH